MKNKEIKEKKDLGDEFWRRISVVESADILKSLGFKETGFKRWEYIIVDHSIKKLTIIIDGDYVFLKDEDPSRRDRVPFAQDIVTLWNWDHAGIISKEELKQLVELIKKGNTNTK
jgi:hypothetical protein